MCYSVSVSLIIEAGRPQRKPIVVVCADFVATYKKTAVLCAVKTFYFDAK